MTPPRVAIVLFNLGAPDSLSAVRPFLLNLFRDPAILRVPFFVRPFLARWIARARVKPATENYALIGGKSPLLELTEEQARALENALPDVSARCFVAMRYWHPLSEAAGREVLAWAPDEIVLLPLYPQYSTTTTGSSLTAWRKVAARLGVVAPVTTVCCYYAEAGFIAATADLLRRAYEEATAVGEAPRVLFSAHGLPERIVAGGDPYQFQIEQTVAAVVVRAGIVGLDHVICYQSRATPEKWLLPSAEGAIADAVRDGVGVLVVPIAFVSEHSETLVELDIEYRHVAERLGIKSYRRVPAQNTDAGFIESLAGMVRAARTHGPGLCAMGEVCPDEHTQCPWHRAA